MVFQDFQLFPFPVGQNVAASLHFDEERLWRCLEQAGVADRVRAMGQKLETPISAVDEAGENVSGGEAQKLAIARALYKDAPFVVLMNPPLPWTPSANMKSTAALTSWSGTNQHLYLPPHEQLPVLPGYPGLPGGQAGGAGRPRNPPEAKGLYASLWNAQAQYYVK